jgi:hypothetical protein
MVSRPRLVADSMVAGHRLFLIFAVSSVCASARHRTIAAANAASALGVGAVTEGFAGQTTMTKLGLLAGWCSSMLSLSPARLRAPLARWVTLLMGLDSFAVGIKALGCCSQHRSGPPNIEGLARATPLPD